MAHMRNANPIPGRSTNHDAAECLEKQSYLVDLVSDKTKADGCAVCAAFIDLCKIRIEKDNLCDLLPEKTDADMARRGTSLPLLQRPHWVEIDQLQSFNGFAGTPAEAAKLYHVNSAGGKQYALVSMHVISKMVPNWTWATFEHKDNPGRCDVIGC
jgi:hypothetical protein